MTYDEIMRDAVERQMASMRVDLEAEISVLQERPALAQLVDEGDDAAIHEFALLVKARRREMGLKPTLTDYLTR